MQKSPASTPTSDFHLSSTVKLSFGSKVAARYAPLGDANFGDHPKPSSPPRVRLSRSSEIPNFSVISEIARG